MAKDDIVLNKDDLNRDGVNSSSYSYTVKVVNENGGNISGATVEYYQDDQLKIRKITLSNGQASYTIFDDDAPLFISVRVSKNGYEDATAIIKRNIIKTIKLSQSTGQYYYNIIIQDTSGNRIKGAVADIFVSDDTSGSPDDSQTASLGAILYASEHQSLNFRISANGYVDKTCTFTGKQSSNDVASNPSTVVLTKSTNAKYYYVIAVKDEGGNPVPGATLGLYKDLYVTPYRSETEDNIFALLKASIVSITGADESTITKASILSDFISGHDLIDFNADISSNLGVTISDKDYQTIQTIGDLIACIKRYLTMYRTNNNGLILIELGSLPSMPNPIYAKAIDADLGYTWEGCEVTQDRVDPTTSKTTPGLTLTIKKYNAEMYYHNYVIADVNTNVPLTNVNVIYSYGDITISKTTDDSGRVSIGGNNYQIITITITKDGFQDYSDELEGSHTVDYRWLRIVPKNSIKVVYNDNTDDEQKTPVSNTNVEIYKIESGKPRLYKGRWPTYENGYIDALSSDFYKPGTKFIISIPDYNVSEYLVPGNPQYIECDYGDSNADNDFVETFNDLSVYSIKNKLAKNNDVDYNSKDFRIKIVDPDSINVYDIFTSTPVIIQNNQKNVVGSVDVTLKPDVNTLRLKVINRYSGYYNPIFKDILFYKNFKYKKDGENKECPFSNVAFDNKYKDGSGKFGVINNMWYHKVNDNKDIEFLNTLTPYYPLIGQYALDYKEDYNIFETNWDMYHYTRHIDVEHSEPCQNIASMKNGLCMFGSKYLNVPEEITINGFDLGNSENWHGEWNDEWITNPDGCPGEVMYKEVNNNSVNFYFFFKKRILRFFYDKLKDEFLEYIKVSSNDQNDMSYGVEGIKDDIMEYVTKNVLKLYKLEKVRVFVKRIKKGQHNSRIENDYTKYLDDYLKDFDIDEYMIDKDGNMIPLDANYFRSHGFVETNTVTLTKMNRDDFDRKLVYNLRTGCQEEFGFTFILKKI